MKRCPNCGYSTENNEKFCQFCGSKLVDEADTSNSNLNGNRCNNCGNVVGEGLDFCPYCGQKMEQEVFAELEKEDDPFDSYYSGNNTASSSKVCPVCGTTYNSKIGECPSCSKARYNYPKDENPSNPRSNKSGSNNSIVFGIICIIASIVTGFVGIIMSIIGISKFKNNKPTLILCIIALLIGITMLAVNAIIFFSGISDDLIFYF